MSVFSFTFSDTRHNPHQIVTIDPDNEEHLQRLDNCIQWLDELQVGSLFGCDMGNSY
jgi:hypothetical protein